VQHITIQTIAIHAAEPYSAFICVCPAEKQQKEKNRGFWDVVVLMSVRPGNAEQTGSADRRIVQGASEDCVGLTARSANV